MLRPPTPAWLLLALTLWAMVAASLRPVQATGHTRPAGHIVPSPPHTTATSYRSVLVVAMSEVASSGDN
ncbi:hypothetical protein Hamer_G011524 [Homarus americanus]|uniref:Uncharacterized protein n=1 Tax=Homarus americanus TaxID=6706 RepID=A0A8J5K1X9_HOMAM|nr:hypothetical protein Hamer_G011524 [Homarus americanus]